MPDNNPNRITLSPDGVRVGIPASARAADQSLSIEIRGVIRCAYNGAEYDAVYSYGCGDSVEPHLHRYLNWQPCAPELVESDAQDHRYVFRFARLAQGVRPTVRVDVDRFVNEFLIPPSAVRDSLSGQLFITAEETAQVSFPWRYAVAAAPALLLTGGLVWVIHRRIAAEQDYDLSGRLHRVRRQAEAVRRKRRPDRSEF